MTTNWGENIFKKLADCRLYRWRWCLEATRSQVGRRWWAQAWWSPTTATTSTSPTSSFPRGGCEATLSTTPLTRLLFSPLDGDQGAFGKLAPHFWGTCSSKPIKRESSPVPGWNSTLEIFLFPYSHLLFGKKNTIKLWQVKPRSCIGQRFAKLEVVVMAAKVVEMNQIGWLLIKFDKTGFIL